MDGDANWQLWFLRLEGWPVFLTVVGATTVFACLAVVGLTWASRRSVIQNAVLAAGIVAVIGAVLLAILMVLTTAAFGR